MVEGLFFKHPSRVAQTEHSVGASLLSDREVVFAVFGEVRNSKDGAGFESRVANDKAV